MWFSWTVEQVLYTGNIFEVSLMGKYMNLWWEYRKPTYEILLVKTKRAQIEFSD